jgi:uncharacterized protein (TIGR02391 family)
MALSDLTDAELLALPLDVLGVEVLRHLSSGKEWNTYNFTVSLEASRRAEAAQRALFEAVGWLEATGLIAHPKPGQSTMDSMFVTRHGEQVLTDGLGPIIAARRLSVELHPRLERVRSQFLIAEYELAAFAALREVEIRVRELAAAPDSAIGVALMRDSFGASGVLTDKSLDGGERVATMELFAGAIGTFKNPPSHRQVDYGDPTEASEVVLLADLLLRMLDRTGARLAAG